MMEYQIFEAEYKGLKFRIEEDYPEIGAYLYVFENGKCTNDYLQNTILECKEFALELFNVPMDIWQEIKTE